MIKNILLAPLANVGGGIETTLYLTENLKSDLRIEQADGTRYYLQVGQPYSLTAIVGKPIKLFSAFGRLIVTPVRGTAEVVNIKVDEEWELYITSGDPDCYLELVITVR